MKRPGFFGALPITHDLYSVEREILLWRAVLDQASEDLQATVNSTEILDWLDSLDFIDVCRLAAVPHKAAAEIMLGKNNQKS